MDLHTSSQRLLYSCMQESPSMSLTSDCKWPTDECWVEINENSSASEAVYKVHM